MRRNCSNIGIAEIVAASWSNNSDNSPAVGASAPPATTAADAATVPLPVDVAATEDIIVFAAATKNGTIQLNNSSYSFLKSDASKMIHAGT